LATHNYKIFHNSKPVHKSKAHTSTQVQNTHKLKYKYKSLHQVSKKPFLAFCLLCYIDALAPRVLRWTICRGVFHHLFSALLFLLPMQETNSLAYVHNTKKVEYKILHSQRCNIRGLKFGFGLSYNSGWIDLCCLLCIFCTPILIFSKGCINCIFTSSCNMS
jgi:hypothetical protein